MTKEKITEMLEAIDPALLDYGEWLSIGMAVQQEGGSMELWDSWSQRDGARYHAGESARKWQSFHGSIAPVTGGTLTELARRHGWTPSGYESLGWSFELNGVMDDDGRDYALSPEWWQDEEISTSDDDAWHPAEQAREYIQTLFRPDEYVGYVVKPWHDATSDRWVPTKGDCSRTAAQLLQEIDRYGDDLGAVFGDYIPQVGTWIRFNPLDGKGVRDENVTEYRYALVESDKVDLGKQMSIIKNLKLPCALVVFSGGKSLHAIVKVHAPSFDEYRRRVDLLYRVCDKYGLTVDRNNRNPSRLSRFPGWTRAGVRQEIVERQIGCASWEEWVSYIEEINDDLPEITCIRDELRDLPPLAPELISGMLREGHKMLISGPSKAGKSFLLIELAIAIAEGGLWLGHRCTKGRVLYVNLELDSRSCAHRFFDVYREMAPQRLHDSDISVWDLRGHSEPLDKLAGKLIRRARGQGYKAVIIDPIYKVLTGDENAAGDMAGFCNLFDKISTELGCAVIYCHHHSKGKQGQKNAIDRSSGSGVFARDPDAILDISPIELSEDARSGIISRRQCEIREGYLRRALPWTFDQKVTEAQRGNPVALAAICSAELSPAERDRCFEEVERETAVMERMTPWRVVAILREFGGIPDTDLWFRHPVHVLDESGVLRAYGTDGSLEARAELMRRAREDQADQRRDDRKHTLNVVFSTCAVNGMCTIADLAQAMGKTEKTVRAYVAENDGFEIEKGIVKKVNKG